MCFTTHGRLCTFDSIIMLLTITLWLFALGSQGNVGLSIMFHICQLAVAVMMETKSKFLSKFSAHVMR